MDGFGYSLTGGSAQLLLRMKADTRAAILKELFASGENGIGLSYLRVSIGASDMNDHVFSYDDLPAGQTDSNLTQFTLGPDETEVIPALKEILAINPKIKILGSPWSAPAWMKTNGNVKGGKLKEECYATYARYFVKYLEAMRSRGISIDAITIQNEPLNEKNTPSMQMLAPEQARFIKDHLGPALKAAKLKNKIILYDHNCDEPEYALTILKDAAASKYVDGSGFHLYGGKIDAMSQVRDAFPNKNLYFTEQMVVNRKDLPGMPLASPVKRIVIGAARNWSRNVLLWNLAADASFGPHTSNGGCTMCQGAITIDGDTVTRNLAYYSLAHASKFVPPGSTRIASDSLETLSSVAFKTPKGEKVLLVANDSGSAQSFSVQYQGKQIDTSLQNGSVATYMW